MAFTPFTPTGAGGTNIPISNGSNQTYAKVDYGNLFQAVFDKPEWDSIIHKRFDEAKFAYILDTKLQEEAPLIGEKFQWSEMGHTQRYNTAESVTVSGDTATVVIPNSETQLFGIGSVIMSKSNKQYKVVAFEDGEYTLETVDGSNAAESDFGNTVSEEFEGKPMWHLYDNTDPCGALVKGSVAFPNEYIAWATIISTDVEYCYDEMTQPVWIGNTGLYYWEAQAQKITEHQMQKEKYIVFSQGIGTTGVGSTPGIIPQLFTYGTSFSTTGAITDKVLVDYDALLKTNGGGKGEYLVLCSHIKMAEVTQAMKDYRKEGYAGLFKDVKEGKFNINFESIEIGGTMYHFMAYDFFAFAPTDSTSTIDYNNLLVFLCCTENGGREKLMTIKYVASFIDKKKENSRLSSKNGHPTAVNGQRVLDNRCFNEAISSKFAFVFRKKNKSGLLITTGV
jgi:hypothetical protein